MSDRSARRYESVIPNGGDMGELIRNYDWSQTSIGAIENWSPSLKTAVSMMLGSRYPMFVWWGEELINIYNDGYAPILGVRHPQALGQSAPQIWSDVWDALNPQIQGVLQEGRSSWNEAFLLIMKRNGYREEAYFTFSYSPIYEDSGIVGLFCAVSEDTRRVLSDRHLQTLKELAELTLAAQTVEEAAQKATQALTQNPRDLPFALLYLLDKTETHARLIATTRLEKGTTVSPELVELSSHVRDLWSLNKVFESGKSRVIQLTAAKYGQMPGGAWSESPKLAVVLPITTSGQTVSGFMVAGVNPFRKFDDDYRSFFNLIVGKIGTAIVEAQAYEAEKQRAEALAEMDRAKTEFFSNVSHQFRTPLTLMLSPIEDALAQTTEPQQRERLELIQRNGLRLLKLVNTLLNFSRIEAGRIEAVFQPTDLANLTAELASVFRSATEQASIKLIVDCPTLPEAIYVDRHLWEKIVLNLISNAFKFTFSGSIAVSLQWQETQVCLTVADTGVGIPQSELPYLFDRFYRVKDTKGRSFEGSGIGLSLVQKLVKLHGGTIDVTSEIDKGSCFTIAIPTGSAHLPPEQINNLSTDLANIPSNNPYVQEAISWLSKPALSAVDLDLTPQSQLASTARVFLVDDNADMRDYLWRLLSSIYRVETFAEGTAVLDAIEKEPPDLVLCDVMMPGIDGFEVLRSLRTDTHTQSMPIILLSARAGEEARIEGLAAGADDYLIKPFSARELLARIEATLKLAELRQTAEAWKIKTTRAEASLNSVLSSIRDGFYTLDRDWRFTYVNDRFLEIANQPRDAIIGKNIWEFYPYVISTQFEQYFERVAVEQIPLMFEYYYPTWGRWFENRLYPISDGIAVLCTEISERKWIEQEKEDLLARETAARNKAEELNRLKDEFLAMVSHELRTPLNPILGWSELMAADRLNSAQTTVAIETILRHAKLQAQLIEDLLDVSRILRHKITLEMKPTDLKQVINDAIATVELNAEAKSLVLATSFDPSTLQVLGDSSRLQQIVWNLLTNAVKFTPEGGKITITLERAEQWARIQVTDTGKGIDPDFLPYVFDRFRQADSAIARSFGGLGLGLAIAHSLVEQHHGSIAVSSPGIGQGATFMISLPLITPDPTLPTHNLPSNISTGSNRLRDLRILVVDDEAGSRDILDFVLQQEGASITVAESGQEALSLCQNSTFDLIISDLGMPKMDGYALILAIRALPQGQQPKAIALTAFAEENSRLRALNVGYDLHISKPIDIQELIFAIAQLTE